MDTISKRLKDTLRNAMQDQMIYSNEAIRQLIFANTGMQYGVDYKESHFAGCLSALKKKNEIIQVSRGEYKRGTIKQSFRKEGLKDEDKQDSPEQGADRETLMPQIRRDVMQSVKRELAYLRTVTKDIALSFDTPEEDIQYMLKLKEMVANLEEFVRNVDA